MKLNSLIGTFLLPSLLLLATSCKKDIRTPIADDTISSKNASMESEETSSAFGVTARAQSELLKSVRQATARFHSTMQAIKSGYEPDEHCVSVPGLGGMGYHWANPALVDPVHDPLKPEVVLYATGPDGELRLVALEYVVINIGQPRPTFGDHPFDIGGTPIPVPHWSLHVWLYENNPNGIHTPFNPNITCP